MLTDFGSQPSETNFNFSASNAVVRVIPLGSGTVHILQVKLIWPSANIQAHLSNATLLTFKTSISDSGVQKNSGIVFPTELNLKLLETDLFLAIIDGGYWKNTWLQRNQIDKQPKFSAKCRIKVGISMADLDSLKKWWKETVLQTRDPIRRRRRKMKATWRSNETGKKSLLRAIIAGNQFFRIDSFNQFYKATNENAQKQEHKYCRLHLINEKITKFPQ